jgi:hypothetical protein
LRDDNIHYEFSLALRSDTLILFSFDENGCVVSWGNSCVFATSCERAKFKRSMTSPRSPAAVDRNVESTFVRAAHLCCHREKERFSSNHALEPTPGRREIQF